MLSYAEILFSVLPSTQDVLEGQSGEICVEIDSGSTEREILISVNTEDDDSASGTVLKLQFDFKPSLILIYGPTRFLSLIYNTS